MSFKVIWSNEADRTFAQIIEFIGTNWTEKEVKHFAELTFKTIASISEFPALFPMNNVNNNRKAFIHKNTSLFYNVDKKARSINLYTFWDNRMDPDKLK